MRFAIPLRLKPYVLVPGLILLAARTLTAAEADVDFVRDIQPIFRRACLRCHGPDKQKADYRLDVRESALRGGESSAPNIIPGKSSDSPLMRYISGTGELVMPPEGERLTEAERATLSRWIDTGATWPDAVAGTVSNKADWWSFHPLRSREELTRGLEQPASIDEFLQIRQKAEGLSPAQPADRATLIRRVSFDLIGLPPTPEEIQAFVTDPDPHAFESLVNRLLDSPRYGERWARHWLDAAHFAETHGHDQDRIREHAWPYRDYLIAAFNKDVSYSRFIEQQVAGDVLFPDAPEATAALGFLAAGPWDESSLKDIREETLDRQVARYLDRDDMVTTVMNNFTSTTVQCARCHDHKFDPIAQTDYYALQAVFAGVERANRRYDADPETGRRRTTLLARRKQLQKMTPELAMELTAPAVAAEVAAWEQRLGSAGTPWKPLDPEAYRSDEGATLTKLSDGSILSGGMRPEKDTVTITAQMPLTRLTAVKLEVLSDDTLPHRGPGRQDNGNLHLSEIEVSINDGPPLPLTRPQADFDQQGWGIARAIDQSIPTAWGIYPQVGQSHSAAFELGQSQATPPGTRITVVLKQLHGQGHLIGRARLMVSDAEPPVRFAVFPEQISQILATSPAHRTVDQRAELARFQQAEQVDNSLSTLPEQTRVYAAAADFEPEGGLKPPPGPRPIHVLHRGDIRQPRAEATAGSLRVVQALSHQFLIPPQSPESARRAALAHWLTDRANPLTWRSIVNRVWHHHFGRGLVATLNDFGHMGETPSHPELLDWLAVEFRDGPQSLKQLHRMILLSHAYQQSVHASEPEHQAAVDPENRLLSRMNRTRLDAECIRDAVLQVSGRLDLRMGGPSDRQFDLQPGIHVTPRVDYSKFNLDSDLGRRRSIYRFLFRTLPDPFMETLDCPSGDQITPARTNSVTVQQALALWNDAFMARHCEFVAARILQERPVDASSVSLRPQVDRASALILGRNATEPELAAWSAYAGQHGLPNLVRILLNSNEFLFLN